MRTLRIETFKTTDYKDRIVPLMWQYADRRAQEYFLSDCFLINSVIEEDRIAYILQQGEKKIVYLMFLTPVDGSDFTIDVDYAEEIILEWKLFTYIVVGNVVFRLIN